MDDAFHYVADHGISAADAYKYTGRNGTCTPSGKKFPIAGYTDVTQYDQNALLEALAQQPVSVAVNAGGFGFQFYKSGVFSGACKNDEASLNHGVLAVGYGNQGGKPFYLVKNSWGTTWGDKGYIRLAIISDKFGQCGIQHFPSFPHF